MKKVFTVIGSNNFNNYSLFEEKLYEVLGFYLENKFDIYIKEKEQNTLDNFCVKFVNENNLNLQRVKIKWNEYGKSAFYVNIKELVYGDLDKIFATNILICFVSKKDKEKDLFFINKILEEFSSCVTDTDFVAKDPEYYIFEG